MVAASDADQHEREEAEMEAAAAAAAAAAASLSEGATRSDAGVTSSNVSFDVSGRIC